MIGQNTNNESTTEYYLRGLYFYLTGDCNLRCRHCWISPAFQSAKTSNQYLPLDVFKSVIDQAKPMGLQGIKLTGGEPLIHPDILEILDFVRTERLILNVETNGVMCTPEVAQALALCNSTFISVSLDGVNADTHEWVRGVDGCFEDAIQGIKNLVSVGLRPQLIMTIMRHNVDQIEKLVDLATDLQASSVKFNIVSPVMRGESMYRNGETLSFEELIEIGDRIERNISPKATIPVFYSHPLAFRKLSNMVGKGGLGVTSCRIFNILGVLADGTYAMCGIGSSLPELTYGNARTHELADVWKNAPFLNEIRSGLPDKLEGICGDCVLKKVCIGHCVALNYYKAKSLMAPFWYCEEAKRNGLFPETRLKTKNL